MGHRTEAFVAGRVVSIDTDDVEEFNEHAGGWWASAQWKLGLSYGDADLARNGLRGNTKMWLSRVQWLW